MEIDSAASAEVVWSWWAGNCGNENSNSHPCPPSHPCHSRQNIPILAIRVRTFPSFPSASEHSHPCHSRQLIPTLSSCPSFSPFPSLPSASEHSHPCHPAHPAICVRTWWWFLPSLGVVQVLWYITINWGDPYPWLHKISTAPYNRLGLSITILEDDKTERKALTKSVVHPTKNRLDDVLDFLWEKKWPTHTETPLSTERWGAF